MINLNSNECDTISKRRYWHNLIKRITKDIRESETLPEDMTFKMETMNEDTLVVAFFTNCYEKNGISSIDIISEFISKYETNDVEFLLDTVINTRNVIDVSSGVHVDGHLCIVEKPTKEDTLCVKEKTPPRVNIELGMEIYVFIPTFQDVEKHWQRTSVDSINTDGSFNAIIKLAGVVKTIILRIENIGILWTTWKSDTHLDDQEEIWMFYVAPKEHTFFNDSAHIVFYNDDIQVIESNFTSVEGLLENRVKQLEAGCAALIDHFTTACDTMIKDYATDEIIVGCVEIKQKYNIK